MKVLALSLLATTAMVASAFSVGCAQANPERVGARQEVTAPAIAPESRGPGGFGGGQPGGFRPEPPVFHPPSGGDGGVGRQPTEPPRQPTEPPRQPTQPPRQPTQPVKPIKPTPPPPHQPTDPGKGPTDPGKGGTGNGNGGQKPTGGPAHPGHGPITNAPHGPQRGLDPTGVHGKAPTIFKGGNPHQPFKTGQRIPNQEDVVRGNWNQPYNTGHGNWQYGSGYWHGGRLINGPFDWFFCINVWVPTDWIYIEESGLWWSETYGYVDFPPILVNAPITIVVQEPAFNDDGTQAYDDNGDPIYVPVYVNAYWDAGYGAYGYTDPVTGQMGVADLESVIS